MQIIMTIGDPTPSQKQHSKPLKYHNYDYCNYGNAIKEVG